MARCGASHWELIKTSLGATPEEPLSGMAKAVGMADPEDWWAWRQKAIELYEKANQQFARLGEVEAAQATGKSWPEWNRNVPAENELEARYAELGGFFTTAPAAGIPQAIEVCAAAVCLLEGVDRSLAIYGESSQSEAGPKTPSIFDNIWAAILIGGLIYGVYKLDSSTASEEGGY